ncbi:MAG: hypothetical protein ACK5NT_06745 [Pyrinomonadaceae bacterium]
MKIKTAIILAVLIAIFSLTLVVFQQEKKLNGEDEQIVGEHEPFEVPDDVVSGVKTQKQHNYSQRFKELEPSSIMKFTEGVALAKDRNYKGIISRNLRVPSIPTVSAPLTEFQFIRNLSCRSDLVVIATTKEKRSYLTEDEAWVFTEYKLELNNIFRNSISLSNINNNTINIEMSGGDVRFKGYHFRMRDDLYEMLKKNKTYLLFLKSFPENDSYTVSDASGIFQLYGNQFRNTSNLAVPDSLKSIDQSSLINQVKGIQPFDCD